MKFPIGDQIDLNDLKRKLEEKNIKENVELKKQREEAKETFSVGAALGGFEFPEKFIKEYTKDYTDKIALERVKKYQAKINKELGGIEKNKDAIDKNQFALDYLCRMDKGKMPKKLVEIFEKNIPLKPKLVLESKPKLEPKPKPKPELEIKQEQKPNPEENEYIDKVKLKKYEELEEEIGALGNNRGQLIGYLYSLGEAKVVYKRGGSYFFPAYIKKAEEVFKGEEEINSLEIPVIREKVREIMERKEEKLSLEEFKKKYKDVWKKNLYDGKWEKWMFIHDYDEEKGAWVRFGEGKKYLKPKHIPMDELDALLREYKNKEKIEKNDFAERADEVKSAEKQMEEADRKIYKEYADKFYLKLSDEKTVNWAGYTAEQKEETLNIQTLVFLQIELSQNPKYKDRAEKLAGEIFAGK